MQIHIMTILDVRKMVQANSRTLKLVLIFGIIGISLSSAVARDSSRQEVMKPINSTTSSVKSALNEQCSKPLSEEMDTTTVCKYSSTSIEQVYQNMLKKHVGSGTASALKSTLPSKNTQYDVRDNADGVVYISYQYKSKKDLLIEVQFEGGSDSYSIKQQKNVVQLTITNSPD